MGFVIDGRQSDAVTASHRSARKPPDDVTVFWVVSRPFSSASSGRVRMFKRYECDGYVPVYV